MDYKTLCEAINEAKRFMARANELKKESERTESKGYLAWGPISSAVRRSSMDLTRALAKMRKY